MKTREHLVLELGTRNINLSGNPEQTGLFIIILYRYRKRLDDNILVGEWGLRHERYYRDQLKGLMF